MYFDVLCTRMKFGIASESNSRLIVDQQGYRTGRTKTNLDEKLTEVGVIDLQYCPTADQVADIFTKPLPITKHSKFVKDLSIL